MNTLRDYEHTVSAVNIEKNTLKYTVELAKDCLANLSKEQAKSFLIAIGVHPNEVANSDDLTTYYVNVIGYLITRKLLEKWLLELVSNKLDFASDWIKKFRKLSK
ncbi:hypothetical protein [Candidatus Uabimicrobium sp. HlEnr_7]|uniref:hypothetical protein n=1 Tax=Candidatus Uabimicrobium helgolandensis TaxID=3095367 RepID=UPI003556B9CE